MRLKFYHLSPISNYHWCSFNQLLLTEMRLGVTCVIHSPVFILSFIMDNEELALTLILNGSISVFMLFGLGMT